MNNAKDSYLLTPTFHWVRQTASRMIAFGFGSGLSPFAPGTAGTLWAWATFLVGEYFLSTEDFLWIIGAGLLLGCWVCGHVSEELGKSDFGGIVWDEIIAFWIVLIFIMPTNIGIQALAFAPVNLKKVPIKEKIAAKLIQDWVDNQILSVEEIDSNAGKKGLKVTGSLD